MHYKGSYKGKLVIVAGLIFMGLRVLLDPSFPFINHVLAFIGTVLLFGGLYKMVRDHDGVSK